MWDACACVFACVVCLCVCVLSSWHSSTNLSSIQTFHSDRKRPDSDSIVPCMEGPFPFVDVQQNLSRVERSNALTRSNVGPSNPVMIFTCQIVSNPRLRPRGVGGGVSRNNDRRIIVRIKYIFLVQKL